MKYFLLVIFLLFCSSTSFAANIDKNKAVDAIIGEAEGSYENMLWVACTIRNRGSLRGVYGANSKRIKLHLYSPKTSVDAVRAWVVSAKEDVTNGCMFWFSDQDLKQTNVKRIIRLEKLKLVKRIGNKKYGNNFYRKG